MTHEQKRQIKAIEKEAADLLSALLVIKKYGIVADTNHIKSLINKKDNEVRKLRG